MPQITVNTDDLLKGSQSLESASLNLSGLADRLSRIPGSVNETGFEGQFAPKIRELVSASQATASSQINQLRDLSHELSTRANDMIAVTQSTSQKMSNLGAFFAEIWNKSPLMWLLGEIGQLPKETLFSYMLLGFINPGVAMGALVLTPIIKGVGQILFWRGKVYKGNPIFTSTPVSSGSTNIKPVISVSLSQNGDWSTDEMGKGTGDTLGINNNLPESAPGHYGYGCLVTTIAMVGRYYNVDITPRDVNNWLRENNGYVKDSSYLDWLKAQDYLNSVVIKSSGNTFIDTGNNIQLINSNLISGKPVILHIPSKANPHDGHWVLGIPSKQNTMDQISVYDPWTGQQRSISTGLITESKAY